jgi:hypothetical protein
MSNSPIEGGSKGGHAGAPPSFHDGLAAQAFRRLTVEILRAIARGDDLSGRIKDNLADLAKHMSATDTPFNTIVNGTVAQLYQKLSSKDPSVPELERIMLASLEMAAETCAGDDFAKARAGKREDTLIATIDRYVINSERRSRKATSER